jgi:hypothetical protein
VSQAGLPCSPPPGGHESPHWPDESFGTGYVLWTHQLFNGLSLQDQLKGQSAEFVQTWWQAGPEPDRSSMHSFPGAQWAAPQAEWSLLDEQPEGAPNAKATAKRAANRREWATARWRNAMGSAMDDGTGGRYASSARETKGLEGSS